MDDLSLFLLLAADISFSGTESILSATKPYNANLAENVWIRLLELCFFLITLITTFVVSLVGNRSYVDSNYTTLKHHIDTLRNSCTIRNDSPLNRQIRCFCLFYSMDLLLRKLRSLELFRIVMTAILCLFTLGDLIMAIFPIDNIYLIASNSLVIIVAILFLFESRSMTKITMKNYNKCFETRK